MSESNIPDVAGLSALSNDERRAVMLINDGNTDESRIEQVIRDLFVWGVVTKASDLHIAGRGDRDSPVIYVNVRTPGGFRNFQFRYPTSKGRHWQTKLFSLTGTPQGASTPDISSTRFEMVLPAKFAVAHGLRPHEGEECYPVDVRVEYTKTFNGFSFTCRLLDSQRAPKLHELGLSYTMHRVILRALAEPSGLILVTGPTGSGKTTLLNAMLGVLNDGTRAIHTIEHPVEIALRGIGPIKQVQIGGNITFSRALRSALRQDPDVIMIGEIRDAETMEIALQAAQTGHLVLATLHTNNSAETYTRAIDLTMDKERDAYRLAQSVKLVTAQRLLDRYEGVSTQRALTRDEREWLSANGMHLGMQITETMPTMDAGRPKRAGKVALLETIVTTHEIKQLLRSARVNTSDIYRAACTQDQFEPLAMGGVRAMQGLGARLEDCIAQLESMSDAELNPCLRLQLAARYGLNYVEVADAIDAFHRAADAGSHQTLEAFFDQLRAEPRVVNQEEEVV
jgi:type II secretory ATPase GspE/PulE/Tfp pilus assembly ATPase PilB-like protein